MHRRFAYLFPSTSFGGCNILNSGDILNSQLQHSQFRINCLHNCFQSPLGFTFNSDIERMVFFFFFGLSSSVLRIIFGYIKVKVHN